MGKQLHDHYLDQLINNLEEVGENRKRIRWIMKDGIWIQKDSFSYNKLCDLIINYYNDDYTLIELKGSRKKRAKAKKQLYSGRRLVKQNFSYSDIYMKIVYYNSGKYEWEQIN